MRHQICAFLLKLWGFRVEGQYPHAIPKCLIVVMPHTSNWDFPLGILVRCSLSAKGNFVAKDSLFKPPFGFIFYKLGGVPVDRSKNNNFVTSVIDTFEKRDELKLVIAPEGTRKKVSRLKTGFYWIARGAGVPMILCKFDWGKRVVSFSEPVYTTDDAQRDFEGILDHFRGVPGCNVEQGIPADFQQQIV
ncbi:MAG: 1-acyl-sn-glycerol-3-phosphate acyltransferase [Saprospiraceae bacterium]|nr:1-acyl-sn-glycerol-3-phosphate acyltransferase [Saprospiraceae bacterium]